MNRLVLNDWCERGILLLTLGILVFGPLAMGAVGGWEFLTIQGLTLGVLALWAVKLWAHRKPQLLWPPLCWVVLAFTAYAVGRYFTADIEYMARQELFQVLVAAFLFFVIVNHLYRQETAQIFSFTMIFLGMAIASVAVGQFLTQSSRVWNLESPYTGRGLGTYISPNDLAGFLEMLIPLATAYILAGRIKPVTRILLGYAVLVMLAGLAVSFSRGGWVACALGMFALLGVLISHRNHRGPALLLLLALLAGGAVFVTKYLNTTISYVQRVEDPLKKDQETLDMRRDMWRAAEQMWHDHFWWGVGPGLYNYRFREYRSEHVQLQPDRAHNDYLNLLADWGTTGGLIVLAGMVVFGAGLVKTWRHVRRAEKDFGSGKSNRFAFFIGATAGLLALAAHSFVDFNLHIPANALLGVALLALLTSNLRFATDGYWFKMGLPTRGVVTVVLAIGIGVLGWQEWCRGHESYWITRAEQLPNYSAARAAALEKAYAADPQDEAITYAIGECYRTQSFDGGDDYAALAQTAMDWYALGMKLDPHDGYNYLRTGMCLDWLGRSAEAGPYYNRADALDPNGYYTADNIGWHYIQTGDYPAARSWFQRSIGLEWNNNPIARTYLEIIEQKLAQQTAGTSGLPAGF